MAVTSVVVLEVGEGDFLFSLDELVHADFEGGPQGEGREFGESLELNLGHNVCLSLDQPVELLSVDIVLFADTIIEEGEDNGHVEFVNPGLLVGLFLLFVLLVPRLLLLEQRSVARLELVVMAVLQQIHEVVYHFCFLPFLP